VFPKDYPELNFNNMKVVLIEAGESLLSSMSDQAKNKSKSYLEKLGVEVMVNTQVLDYDGEKVILKGREAIATKTLLWAAGIKPNGIGGICQEQSAPNGRLIVNEFNQIEGSKNIFALGDICIHATDENPKGLPQVAQVALQHANRLANNLLGELKNKSWKAFKYNDLGAMATIGRKLAVVDLPFIKFQGLLAWLTWLFVHLMAILGVKNKLFIFLDWSWNYLAFDPSLRLLIRPKEVKAKKDEQLVEK